jgi:hypothetical protein
MKMLKVHQVPPAASPISVLTEDVATWYIAFLKNYSPTTERLYLTAEDFMNFYPLNDYEINH